jgi:hypothetical protein
VSASSPRPPPGPTADPATVRAPEPGERLRLPTGDQAWLLLALCRRGEAHQPYGQADGWAWYRWEDSEGRVGEVGLRTADHPEHTDQDELAAQALTSAPLRQRSLVELAAVLTRLLELDGAERRWRLERVAELLYGPAQRSSHRERQLPSLHGWLALLQRGHWRLGADQTPSRRRSKTSRPSCPPGPLVTVERLTRSSATARLRPDFAASLASAVVEVPAETFRLPQRGHSNPHGNRPSLATRARVRVAAARAHSRNRGRELKLEQLLADHAGVDLAPVSRRRRLATWFDVLTADLAAIRARLGVGLAAVPKRARHILATVLRLVDAEHGPSAAQQRLAARPPP